MRKLGICTSVKTQQSRGWVTRKWRIYAGYVNDKNRFRVLTLSDEQRRSLRKIAPKELITPKGLLVQIPSGGKARITKRNTVVVSKGNLREETFIVDNKKLTINPKKEIKRIIELATGTNKQAFLTVRGFESVSDKYTILSLFTNYIAELVEEVDEDEDSELHGKIGIKIVSIKPNRKKHEKPKTKRTNRNKGRR